MSQRMLGALGALLLFFAASTSADAEVRAREVAQVDAPRSAAANLARSGQIRMSTRGTSIFGLQSNPWRANDGSTKAFGLVTNLAFTKVASNGWIEVDLGAPQPIGHVVVYNRVDGLKAMLNGAVIELSDLPCDHAGYSWLARSAPYARSAASQTFSFDGTLGRYVCLRQSRNVAISVVEIEVLADAGVDQREAR